MAMIQHSHIRSNWLKPNRNGPRSPWGLLALLALGTFAMGTDSFVIAGILPQISKSLTVSTTQAGQLITIFSLTYALCAPVLAVLTSKLPRKQLLVIALGIFVAGNITSALAPDYTMLLLSRILAGVGAALYTPTASAAATALLPHRQRGVALSSILAGLTMGTVFGVPIGTYIGLHISWQASLWLVASLGLAAMAGLAWRLPGLPLLAPVALRDRIRVLRDQRILLIIAVMALATAASIMVYTYIADMVHAVAGLTGSQLSIVLLAWGIGGSVGSFGSGALADRIGANKTLAAALCLLVLTLLALPVAHSEVLLIAVVMMNGLAAWSVASPNNHRLVQLAPHLPSVVVSYNSCAIYLGQAAGAFLGGIALGANAPVTMLPLFAAAVGSMAVMLHGVTIYKMRRGR